MMKFTGFLLMIAAIAIGAATEYLPKGFDFWPFVLIAWIYFLIGIYFLMISSKKLKVRTYNYYHLYPRVIIKK